MTNCYFYTYTLPQPQQQNPQTSQLSLSFLCTSDAHVCSQALLGLHRWAQPLCVYELCWWMGAQTCSFGERVQCMQRACILGKLLFLQANFLKQIQILMLLLLK